MVGITDPGDQFGDRAQPRIGARGTGVKVGKQGCGWHQTGLGTGQKLPPAPHFGAIRIKLPYEQVSLPTGWAERFIGQRKA